MRSMKPASEELLEESGRKSTWRDPSLLVAFIAGAVVAMTDLGWGPAVLIWAGLTLVIEAFKWWRRRR